ncbi:PQQ-binding-like beta-propeller repeat protein [Marinilongibacter aquaticus]|uniref:outer membrane protein assembly factor BamB family protein n=1 Tax=Marinilongibacter aquaticus TaxID=2975157 RepID=UPI0021BD6642|nr:PQQ-binding-like beta-propeller repeat protein [Marinilongibacter aquaticus]UBM60898.1 PQQ-binding-like beta-propeller repeat protein [Marinilongibacter aquaticus]
MANLKTILSASLLLTCQLVLAQRSWTKELPGIGTFSSPRLTDLNQDGVKDIVLGAGRLEFESSDSAMIALDGTDGHLLWNVSANDQIFITAGLKDLNGDQIDDVLLGGRSSELKAISGSDGQTIWAFDTLAYKPNNQRWFNFYDPQFIHDVDGDGLEDILISNGGDIWVKPHDPNRAAGRLCVISSADGRLLAQAEMPDHKEIYMSVSILMNEKEPLNSRIIFGTGGETIDGNLFVGTLGMVLEGDLTKAQLLANGMGKGFVAPPAWVDITQDGIADIVANSVDGRVLAFDGQSLEKLWSTRLNGTEAYSSMGIGYFNTDNTPDFFVSFAQGVWPDLTWTKQAMLDGKDGHIAYLDTLGFYQTSSPVVVDVTGDGQDEVLLSVDYVERDSLGRKEYFTTVVVVGFTENKAIPLIDGVPGHNVSSTPWVGDMNGDGNLDIVFCHATNPYHTYTFDGMRVNCLQTTIPLTKKVLWGGYMGSNADGIFKP